MGANKASKNNSGCTPAPLNHRPAISSDSKNQYGQNTIEANAASDEFPLSSRNIGEIKRRVKTAISAAITAIAAKSERSRAGFSRDRESTVNTSAADAARAPCKTMTCRKRPWVVGAETSARV